MLTRRCFGLFNLTHFFQRLWLDLEGYRRFGYPYEWRFHVSSWRANDLINDNIELINVSSGALLATFQVGPNENFGDLSFSPDGTLLSSHNDYSYLNSMTLWGDIKTASLVYRRVTEEAEMFWLPAGDSAFFLAIGPTTPRLWKVQRGREQTIVSSNSAQLGAFDPVHNRLALAYLEGPIRVLDAQTGNKLFSVPLPDKSTLDGLRFTPVRFRAQQPVFLHPDKPAARCWDSRPRRWQRPTLQHCTHMPH